MQGWQLLRTSSGETGGHDPVPETAQRSAGETSAGPHWREQHAESQSLSRTQKHWANQKDSSIPGDCAMWYFLVNAVALTEWVNHAYIIYMYQCAKTLVLYHHILPSNRFLGTKHLLYSVLLCRHQYYIIVNHKSLLSVYWMDLIYTSVHYMHLIELISQQFILLCTGKLYACVITQTIVFLNLYNLFIDN